MNKFSIHKNPFTEEYEEITEAVKANEGYCPCMLNKDEDTKCMCKAFRDCQDTDFCHCGRFYKVRDYETLAVIGDISDEDGMRRYTDWCETLMCQDFVVIGIPLNELNYQHGSSKYLNLCKSIIAKADAVLILGHTQNLGPMVEQIIDWTSQVGKKLLTREDLMK